MQAYFTISPAGDFTIELAHETTEEKAILERIRERRINQKWFGGMGAFDGIEVHLRPFKALPTIAEEGEEIRFTCPANVEESAPSCRSGDDSH